MNQGKIASSLLEVMRDVWCERNDTKESEFKCKRCEFEQDGKCLVKRFMYNRYKEQKKAEQVILNRMLATEPCENSEVAE